MKTFEDVSTHKTTDECTVQSINAQHHRRTNEPLRGLQPTLLRHGPRRGSPLTFTAGIQGAGRKLRSLIKNQMRVIQ